jgi:uncharacterized repeat protein (TIGR03803 family)
LNNAQKIQSAFLLLAFWAAGVITSPAQTFATLVNFDGTDGQNPYAALVQGTDGNFYGTTDTGGAYRTGTIFKITPTGTLTTIYSFCLTGTCNDGADPESAPVQARNGKFYGTTPYGGTGGVIYQMTTSGALTTLYLFCSQVNSQGACTDGSFPWGGLIQAGNGNFYGTTVFGGDGVGAFCAAFTGCGTVFEITAAGVLTTLYNFCTLVDSQGNCNDGYSPEATLIQASNGNFYGTTSRGGTSNGGTVFEITPAGKLTTLHTFCAQLNSHGFCTDGNAPAGGLIQTNNGNLYGVTSRGGAGNVGTVFSITQAQKFTTVYNFCPSVNCTGGFYPEAGLIQGTDGNIYGTTSAGGTSDVGTIFEIAAGGKVTTLHNFNGTDGQNASASLLQATDGNFYGTAPLGGSDGDGTVFRLAAGLAAFVETNPTSGNPGSKVIILGNKLKSATAVTFNGTAATFSSISNSQMTATVPAGATTGTVEVTTPSGTLKSKVAFRVP